jgi:dTDP-4-dehydrorhamnose 3,5-epimerase
LEIKSIGIEGAYLILPEIHQDNRGNFREWFKPGSLENLTDSKFEVTQANLSVSNEGVIRGIHLTTGERPQSKYVTCMSGRILDVIVDLRTNSPTYKKWVSIELDPCNGKSVYITQGLGHAFMALEKNSSLMYLVNQEYDPANELGVNPLDPGLGIDWPAIPAILSEKDSKAPFLSELVSLGKLPQIPR